MGQFVKNEYPENIYQTHESKSDKEEMAHDIIDDVINNAVNYSHLAIKKFKYYDKGPEVVNSDDYDEDIPQTQLHYPIKSQIGQSEDEEKSDATVVRRVKNAKNWEINRKRMIKNLNEGKHVKPKTREEYKPKYNKKSGLYY